MNNLAYAQNLKDEELERLVQEEIHKERARRHRLIEHERRIQELLDQL